MSKLKAKIVFRLRAKISFLIIKLRLIKWKLLGMKLGSNIYLNKIIVTWPNQVKIGNNCKIEHGVYFKFSGIWQPGNAIEVGDRTFIGSGCEFNIHKGITIGNDTLLASGCKFIDHNHGIKLGSLMRLQKVSKEADDIISIGSNVWLGFNVVVLKGVRIGDGAVVAAGSVVNKSIPQDEIWGGIPAKFIKKRSN